ncbi:hypothetical protein WN982_15385 [Paraburkholderia sp. IMGN_8]|uniref:hypothetical protein n=1 Tax=Paraburkholderia sp. IMGN_8 TaxID=3136564 RepID=UPI00310122CB
MKELATLMIASGFVCAASVAMAADAKYPYAPPPAYAQEELQKVIDAATGPMPVASTVPQIAATVQSPATLCDEANADRHANPQDQPHAAASVPKHGGRASKAHRHERHKFV